jgi:hypothetical protein
MYADQAALLQTGGPSAYAGHGMLPSGEMCMYTDDSALQAAYNGHLSLGMKCMLAGQGMPLPDTSSTYAGNINAAWTQLPPLEDQGVCTKRAADAPSGEFLIQKKLKN